MESKSDAKKVTLLKIYAAIVTATLLTYTWILSFGLSYQDMYIALIPNILCNFIAYIVVEFILPRTNKLELKSIQTELALLIQATEKLNMNMFKTVQTHNPSEFDKEKTERKSHLGIFSSDDTENDISQKLIPYVKQLSIGIFNFKTRFPHMLSFLIELIDERMDEIHSISDGQFDFKTEIQRESFTNKVFEYLHSVPDIHKIQSLTWDHEDYFFDYWKSYVSHTEFIKRNTIAEQCKVTIERIFILNRGTMNDDKKALLQRIYDYNQLHQYSKIRWFYEEDLLGELSHFKESKSSFLLLIDKKNRVKLITENFQSDEKKSNMRILATNDETLERQDRFQKLWKLDSRASTIGKKTILDF